MKQVIRASLEQVGVRMRLRQRFRLSVFVVGLVTVACVSTACTMRQTFVDGEETKRDWHIGSLNVMKCGTDQTTPSASSSK